MSNLEAIIKHYGQNINDFTPLQLGSLQAGLDNKLDISRLANPNIDEVVMNFVVHDAINKPNQPSMLPYLYSRISFNQIGAIRKNIELGNHDLVDELINIFTNPDINNIRKSVIATLATYEISYADLLNPDLSDQELLIAVRTRTEELLHHSVHVA